MDEHPGNAGQACGYQLKREGMNNDSYEMDGIVWNLLQRGKLEGEGEMNEL